MNINFSTTSPLGIDFPQQLFLCLFNAISEGTIWLYRIIWDFIKQILIEHWCLVIIILVIVLLFSLVEYLMTRRWALLGSVLYNYLYFGTLLIIAWIFGPEVFANDWFKLVLFIIYVVCFILVGKILNGLGIRR